MKYIKLLLSTTSFFLFVNLYAQTPKLQKIWETDNIIAVPESVLPDVKKGILYVSLIDGTPWGADGKGGIATLSTDGKQYNGSWITGLHAPKGMGLHRNRMYVADISEVVVIDVAAGKIEKRIPIEGAQALNDVTISTKGVVYVSDSKTAKIWRIEKDQPRLYLDSMQGVNGLKAVKDDLIIAAGKNFLKADKKGKVTTLAQLPQGGDGIEPTGNGNYLVTSWGGYIFYVTAGGQVTTLLDVHEQKINTADIGYDAAKKIMYVPTFFAKTVAAYQVQ